MVAAVKSIMEYLQYQKMCYYYWGQDNELFFKNKNSMGIARSSLYDGRGTEAYFLICKYNPEW